jgi:hypothetical protein
MVTTITTQGVQQGKFLLALLNREFSLDIFYLRGILADCGQAVALSIGSTSSLVAVTHLSGLGATAVGVFHSPLHVAEPKPLASTYRPPRETKWRHGHSGFMPMANGSLMSCRTQEHRPRGILFPALTTLVILLHPPSQAAVDVPGTHSSALEHVRTLSALLPAGGPPDSPQIPENTSTNVSHSGCKPALLPIRLRSRQEELFIRGQSSCPSAPCQRRSVVAVSSRKRFGSF